MYRNNLNINTQRALASRSASIGLFEEKHGIQFREV